jgi:hypothetical protein
MKPTPKQIEKEIKALEACKIYVPKRTAFGDDNHHKFDLQIEHLRDGIDMTSGEFYELSLDEQSVIQEAEDWKEGDVIESPSSGWSTFKPKK